jgi:maltose-binding protein MalE
MPNSIEALADEKVVAAFVYPRDIIRITEQNPRISLGYYALPQIGENQKSVDSASYYSFVIPVASKRPYEALGFIKSAVFDQNMGSNARSARRKGEDTATIDRTEGRNYQSKQLNSAESYYKGYEPDEVDAIMRDVLDNKLSLEQAANKINQSLKKIVP